jgi:hypothetical protein
LYTESRFLQALGFCRQIVIGPAPGEHGIGALAKGLRVALVTLRSFASPLLKSQRRRKAPTVKS